MNALRQTARARLRGALLGLTTPFTAAGAFDEEPFRRNIDFYIFNPALEHRYLHALEARDLGELRQLHAALSPLRRFFSEVDAPVTLKAAQDMVGLAGGPVRLPMSPMTGEQRGRLRDILLALGTKVVD
jgi:dihydrodipicolinate synthase/N-acetylneuraminate lyase